MSSRLSASAHRIQRLPGWRRHPGRHASAPNQSDPRRLKVLVLGETGGLGDALIRKLERNGAAAQALNPGTDSETTHILSRSEWTAVAIVTRDDVLALRLTLLCAHLRPDLPLWTTLFDKTTVHQLRAVGSFRPRTFPRRAGRG